MWFESLLLLLMNILHRSIQSGITSDHKGLTRSRYRGGEGRRERVFPLFFSVCGTLASFYSESRCRTLIADGNINEDRMDHCRRSNSFRFLSHFLIDSLYQQPWRQQRH
ncbi:hypothetical protein F5Y16DRAFT_368140 [Xylariaceae sp. FL0255]|nr:hypothetical protein F5Y16DRAFT_368140 [Xylariaceae sp. FL0255]